MQKNQEVYMKTRSLITLLLALALILSISAFAQDKSQEKHACKENQTKCFCGSKIDKNIYADHDGKRIYFCCAQCRDNFKKNPDKCIKEMHAKSKKCDKSLKTQTICPNCSGKIDKNIYADYKGKRIYFCCAQCRDNFKKNPDKCIKEMHAKSKKCDKSLKAQTICPNCGMKIDKNFHADKDNHRIYACNQGCADIIQKDFDKYAQKLKDKGEKPECCPKDTKKAEIETKCGGCPLAKMGCGPK